MRKQWKANKYRRWFDKRYKIILENEVAKEVFNLLFFDFHDSTTLTEAYYAKFPGGLAESKEQPKYEPMDRPYRPHISDYYSLFMELGYLESKEVFKDVPSKKGKIYKRKSFVYRINEKPFLEYFKEEYNWQSSKQALFIIKALLRYKRDYFEIRSSKDFEKRGFGAKREYFKWQYNENLNIFENFMLFLKSFMVHDSVIGWLDSKPTDYVKKLVNDHKKILVDYKNPTKVIKEGGIKSLFLESEPCLRKSNISQTKMEDSRRHIEEVFNRLPREEALHFLCNEKIKDRLKLNKGGTRDILYDKEIENLMWDENLNNLLLIELKKIIIDSDYNFEIGMLFLDKVNRITPLFGFLFSVFPDAYTNIVLGLFDNYADRILFQRSFALEIIKSRNNKKKIPVTRRIYDKIKIEKESL